jgi:hypothetical protein
LKLYVYPLRNAATGDLTTIENLDVAPELRKLYGYLAGRGSFVNLDNYKPEYLSIFSRDVLKKIAAGDEEWRESVPPEVSGMIAKRRFFGCKG